MENKPANLLPATIKNQTVLTAALDWGMGHTTRLVVIVRTLLQNNNKVYFAGNQKQNDFIQSEFPSVKLLEMPGYGIRLDSNRNTYLQALQQFSKFNKGVKLEQQWLQDLKVTLKFDLIISDNRYGLHLDEVPSIILTHQLNLQIPQFKKMVNKRVAKLISKFHSCWIPDDKNRSLTGELTNAKLSIPMHFIGSLCRFEKLNAPLKFNSLVILSGPEPERTHFLEMMIQKMKSTDINAAFVGAKVNGFDSFRSPTTNELELLIAQSKTVYSRAGYTTIMELDALNKPAVLYPTKGQYEQEYLASYLKLSYFEFVVL